MTFTLLFRLTHDADFNQKILMQYLKVKCTVNN